MGFIKDLAQTADFGSVFTESPAQEAAQRQVGAAMEGVNRLRLRNDILRADAAPLRQLRNTNLNRLQQLIEGGRDDFSGSPEFTNVYNAAASVADDQTGRARRALLDRAGHIASGELPNFSNRLLTLAGIGAGGLNTSNTSLQNNIDARTDLLNRAGEAGAAGIIGEANSKRQTATTGAAGLLSLFSDIRLKKNIKPLGKVNGFNWYQWDWNDKASVFGLSGSSQGVIAQEVLKTHPEAVSMINGYYQVNYEQIGSAPASAA